MYNILLGAWTYGINAPTRDPEPNKYSSGTNNVRMKTLGLAWI